MSDKTVGSEDVALNRMAGIQTGNGVLMFVHQSPILLPPSPGFLVTVDVFELGSQSLCVERDLGLGPAPAPATDLQFDMEMTALGPNLRPHLPERIRDSGSPVGCNCRKIEPGFLQIFQPGYSGAFGLTRGDPAGKRPVAADVDKGQQT